MELLAHDHCGNCFRMRCDDLNLSCGVTACGNGCGFQMHYCKISDHSHVCQKASVSCPNVEYGCSAIMLRQSVKDHLKSCPASIVFCTMEWRRCPIYSKHRLSWVPFFQPNPVLVKGHLDVELALRDQKVLEEIARQRMRKGKAKVEIERRRLNDVATGERQRDKSLTDIKETSEEIEEVLSHSQRVNSIIGSNTPWETKKPITERDKGVVSRCDSENATTEASEEEAVLLKLEVISKTAEEVCLREHSSELCERSADVVPPPPACVPMYLDRPLGLNVMIESLPKFMKQSPMYSIPCNQVFRRDEYNDHFRNVHNDIQGGLNGWLQHRCPLTQYGCTFVSYRFRPHGQCERLFFSQELGSFGVKPCAEVAGQDQATRSSSEGSDLLTTYLPVEILMNIMGRLDGFSLRNFSCTSKRLREICQELVEKRGMVLMDWEKRVYENGTKGWRIRQKKWCFSTSFAPVDEWVHAENSFMAAHIEKCPYFDHHIPPKVINFSKLGSKRAQYKTKWSNGNL